MLVVLRWSVQIQWTLCCVFHIFSSILLVFGTMSGVIVIQIIVSFPYIKNLHEKFIHMLKLVTCARKVKMNDLEEGITNKINYFSCLSVFGLKHIYFNAARSDERKSTESHYADFFATLSIIYSPHFHSSQFFIQRNHN